MLGSAWRRLTASIAGPRMDAEQWPWRPQTTRGVKG
jgi:hypothetical protein